MSTPKPFYPKFDHNAKKVAAQNAWHCSIGDKVYLSYSVDGRGNGHYNIEDAPLERTTRYDNIVRTPDKTGTVVSRYNGSVVWVDRDI